MSGEHGEPAEVGEGVLRGEGDGGNFQALADCLGDCLHWHTLLADCMVNGAWGVLFQCEAVEPGGVEDVDGGPAVESIADVGGDFFSGGRRRWRR